MISPRKSGILFVGALSRVLNLLSSRHSPKLSGYSFSLSNSDLTIRIPLLITSVFVVLSRSEHSSNIPFILSSRRNSNRLCLDLSDFGLGDTLIPPFLSVQVYYNSTYRNVNTQIKNFIKLRRQINRRRNQFAL